VRSVSGHVFISYSKADRVYVDKLAAHLISADVQVWYDHEMTSDDRFDAEIEREITTCAALLVVLTPDSAASGRVRREIVLADERGKALLPLLLKPCTVPIRLQGLHRNDVQNGQMPPQRFIEYLQQLTG
jgi:hypothetical protein